MADRARALQRTMYESGAHSAYPGLNVLRDLGRHRGEPVLAPIVYTSALNLGELFAEPVMQTFGEPVWIISQGPQVLLDAQVTEVRGGLLCPPISSRAGASRYRSGDRRLHLLDHARRRPDRGHVGG
ncbi:Putative phenyloxazoline synthase MbtB [Mycobacteroides abscessus subsp. abscessus]|nr:Putative phenyloxazoline synthase MbtB [Mycobacteroides abscessus subsp. abscessus]